MLNERLASVFSCLSSIFLARCSSSDIHLPCADACLCFDHPLGILPLLLWRVRENSGISFKSHWFTSQSKLPPGFPLSSWLHQRSEAPGISLRSCFPDFSRHSAYAFPFSCIVFYLFPKICEVFQSPLFSFFPSSEQVILWISTNWF